MQLDYLQHWSNPCHLNESPLNAETNYFSSECWRFFKSSNFEHRSRKIATSIVRSITLSLDLSFLRYIFNRMGPYEVEFFWMRKSQ
jgi:hypothetical protein